MSFFLLHHKNSEALTSLGTVGDSGDARIGIYAKKARIGIYALVTAIKAQFSSISPFTHCFVRGVDRIACISALKGMLPQPDRI